MKISLKKDSQIKSSARSQTLVVFYSCTESKTKSRSKQISAPNVAKSILNLLTSALSEGTLSGSRMEATLLGNVNVNEYKNLLAISLGSSTTVLNEDLRQAAAAAHKTLLSSRLQNADFLCDNIFARSGRNTQAAVSAVVEGLLLSDYEFDEYKSKETRESRQSLKSAGLLCSNKTNTLNISKGLQAGQTLAECINFSRRLGDTPGNLMTPAELAKTTQTAARGTKLKVTVWDKARIKKERMGGLYGVSLGSSAEPRFIIMEYKGATSSKKPVCFVGKGLTFDSGGISIKPAQAMDEMKYDMCGGATVIGTMLAIAKLKLKVNAIAFVPSSENMPGPLANKPGDILTARNGKTVEVLNTDAEGRLILMDALSYATEKKPAVIFDAATLTGAILIALGNIHTGVFTRDEKLFKKIQQAADASGELIWPMPIHDHHVKDMKGRHADLQNISAQRGAGSSTAAAFLEQFVDKNIPWAHFDIAGTAWDVNGRLNYCPQRGASGVMVRTFVELAKTFS